MSHVEHGPQPASPATAPPAAEAAPLPPLRPPVNWRSLLLGLAGVIFICGLSPWNDFVLNNTFLVGNYLPIGLLLFFLSFIILINAPLWRWSPRLAFTSGELAVAMGMMLVSCTLPASGLMRYLPYSLVTPYHHAADNAEFLRLLEEARIPDWILPEFSAPEPAGRMNDPIVTDFWGRTPLEQHTLRARLHATPWAAWARPAAAWALFLTAFYGAILCLMIIVRRQWVQNERLPFPLASIYLSLIESPQPGRALNPLFRASAFWIAFGIVFTIHGFNAMHLYHPQNWPQIPVSFNLAAIFADTPLRYAEHHLTVSRIFFSIVGITFFLQTKVAFSLWVFYILFQGAIVAYGTRQAEFNLGMQTDQLFGALLTFCAVVLWIGRHHWRMVIAQMFRRPRSCEPQGRYLPNGVAGWGFVICIAAMVVWLWAAGMTAGGAVLLVLLMLMVMLIMARLVAETGLMYMQIPMPFYRPWVFALSELPQALAFRSTTTNYFFSGWFHQLFGHDTRESLSPFAIHALRIADGAADDHQRTRRRTIAFTGALVLALAVGYVVSGAAMLHVNYSHANTLDRAQEAPVNPWGAVGSVHWHMLHAPSELMPPRTGPAEAHSRTGHFAFGAALTALLGMLRLHYIAWPLHPAGYLLAFSYPMKLIWFSIFLGWLAKAVIVRFGGVDLFRAARPLFIGLIIGEAGAAAFWLLASLALHTLGLPFHSIRLLPA